MLERSKPLRSNGKPSQRTAIYLCPAPEPFSSDGAAWLLSASTDLPITRSNAVDQLAPLPTLTSVGSRGEETQLAVGMA